MTTHVLGVGLGLFLLIALWAVTIVLYIVSMRTEKQVGSVVILVATIVTLVLVLIPRDSEIPAPPVVKLYDHFFIWRTLVVIFLGVSAFAGFIVVLITHFMEPRFAVPIKKWKL